MFGVTGKVKGMVWGYLNFLAEPWFVIPWYAVGLSGMALVIYDSHQYNTHLKPAMKWAWPIIVLFFSGIGLALYYGTARAPGIGEKKGEEKKKAHQAYEKNMGRRVNGAVIHCIAGDGIGIMTGMVIARAVGMSFWQEFWFEYLVGYIVGWFVFQYKSMTMMTDNKMMALAMAFRAEFFSMLTVMAGMGAVMVYVTAAAVTEQPKPLTYAFWGFGMLGLLVGFVFTYPINWMMVKIGWKHGMGGMRGEHQAKSKGSKGALLTAMVILGFGALIIPALLAELRFGTPIGQDQRVGFYFHPEQSKQPPRSGLKALQQGIGASISYALENLQTEKRPEAMHAIDAALRAAEVGKAAAPEAPFKDQVDKIKAARRSLHMGSGQAAKEYLAAALSLSAPVQTTSAPTDPARYRGATVISARGTQIGHISAIEDGGVELQLGGIQNVWGFWNFTANQTVRINAGDLVFGPRRAIGLTLAALPSLQ